MSKYISVTETAKLVRAALKDSYGSIKFSVVSKSYSGGASIRVSWVDGPTSQEVRAITGKFSGSSFDGMQDLKSYHTSELNGESVHFGADSVSTDREFSVEFLVKIAREVCQKYDQPMPEIKPGGQYSGASVVPVMPYQRIAGSDRSLDQLIHHVAHETSAIIPGPTPAQSAPKSAGVTAAWHDHQWVISGNTYPHRQILKDAGARWNKATQSWIIAYDPEGVYYTMELPKTIRAIVTDSPAVVTPEPAVNSTIAESDRQFARMPRAAHIPNILQYNTKIEAMTEQFKSDQDLAWIEMHEISPMRDDCTLLQSALIEKESGIPADGDEVEAFYWLRYGFDRSQPRRIEQPTESPMFEDGSHLEYTRDSVIYTPDPMSQIATSDSLCALCSRSIPADLTICGTCQARKDSYDNRKQNRISRLKKRATNAAAESHARWERSHKMVEHIPFGQPILVGHHSEKRHRNLLAKVWNNDRKAYEAGQKADHYTRRAAAAESNRAISSDDPAALVLFRQKLATLEARQEEMKRINGLIKKVLSKDKKQIAALDADYKKAMSVGAFRVLTTEERKVWDEARSTHRTAKRAIYTAHVAELAALAGISESRAIDFLTPDDLDRIGYPAYALTNNNGNIRRIRERIADMEKTAQKVAEMAESEPEGILYPHDATVTENAFENRLQIAFPGKPAQDIIKRLKQHGFHWSRNAGVWQRMLTDYARADVRIILGNPIPQVAPVDADSDYWPSYTSADLYPTDTPREWLETKPIPPQPAQLSLL